MFKLSKIFKKKKEEREIIWGEDFGKTQTSKELEKDSAQQQNLGFLSDLAIASSSNVDVASYDEKIERINRRLDRIIERIELLERKIERIENRIDLKFEK